MPLYDYDCAACGNRFEVIHGVHADGPTTCPACGAGPVRKAFAAPAIHFKGSGWAKKERRASSSGRAKSADPSGASSTADAGSSAASGTDSGTASSSASEASTATSAATGASAPD